MATKDLRLPTGRTISYEADTEELQSITEVDVYVELLDGPGSVHVGTSDGRSARWVLHDSGALLIRNEAGKTVACFGPAAWRSVHGKELGS